ncbi:MAG: hypothetical protein IJF07_08530 [Lachnospiraceae bacterium]|nr:hypothetical protein [Lachnospiraceae bacterium]
MGFLDRLLKKEARKIISSVVDDVVDDVIDNIREKREGNSSSAAGTTKAATPSASKVTSSTNPDEEWCESFEEICKRIEKVVAQEWTGYELRRNISSSEMGADVKARDYDYGLYLNGAPKAMITILHKPYHGRRSDNRLAHEACQNQGVFCMNLFTHLPNRYSYISEQLRNNVAQ